MTDPFSAYGSSSTAGKPTPLVGQIGTRAKLRLAYSDAVDLLHECATMDDLEEWRAGHKSLIAQIHAEHEFFWAGDGDFLGLEREIEWALARVDDRLDFPRRA